MEKNNINLFGVNINPGGVINNTTDGYPVVTYDQVAVKLNGTNAFNKSFISLETMLDGINSRISSLENNQGGDGKVSIINEDLIILNRLGSEVSVGIANMDEDDGLVSYGITFTGQSMILNTKDGNNGYNGSIDINTGNFSVNCGKFVYNGSDVVNIAFLEDEYYNVSEIDLKFSSLKFKTINGNSIVGEGNITISDSGASYDDTELRTLISNKQNTITDLSTIRTNASAGASIVSTVNSLSTDVNTIKDKLDTHDAKFTTLNNSYEEINNVFGEHDTTLNEYGERILSVENKASDIENNISLISSDIVSVKSDVQTAVLSSNSVLTALNNLSVSGNTTEALTAQVLLNTQKIDAIGIYYTEEPGFFIIDTNRNIGFKVTDTDSSEITYVNI